MKLALLLALAAALGAGALALPKAKRPGPRRCDPYAEHCPACKDCSACHHCHVLGGKCSVCFHFTQLRP